MTIRRIELTQPGSGKALNVAEEHADTWRALGYRDKPKPRVRKKPGPKMEPKSEG